MAWLLSLDGKVAIVTGATSGIGERIAEVFVAEGARVVMFAMKHASTSSATPGATSPAGVQRIRDFMASGLGGFATLEEAAAIAAYQPHRRRRVNPTGLMKVPRQRRDGRWYWHWNPRFLDHGRTEVPREDFEAIFHAATKNVRVTALLVRGTLSDVVTEEGVRRAPAPRRTTVEWRHRGGPGPLRL